jgi:hypothetical protein
MVSFIEAKEVKLELLLSNATDVRLRPPLHISAPIVCRNYVNK